jgi:hypothetical protein
MMNSPRRQAAWLRRFAGLSGRGYVIRFSCRKGSKNLAAMLALIFVEPSLAM